MCVLAIPDTPTMNMVVFGPAECASSHAMTSNEKHVTHAQKIKAYILNMQASSVSCPSKIRACSSDPGPTLRICTQSQHKHLSGLELSQVTIEPDGRIKACVMYEDKIIWMHIQAEKVRLVSKYCNEMELSLNPPRSVPISACGARKMKSIQQTHNMQHAHNATFAQMGLSDWYMQEFHGEAVTAANPEPFIHTPGSLARAIRDRKRHLQRYMKLELGNGHSRGVCLDVLRQAIFSFWGRPSRAQVLSTIEEEAL